MTQKRSMTELEQLTILTSFQETAIESLARRNRYLKKNLFSALAWLVLALVIIGGTAISYMNPVSLQSVFHFITNLFHNSLVHWTMLTFFMVFMLLLWAAIVWTEIRHGETK